MAVISKDTRQEVKMDGVKDKLEDLILKFHDQHSWENIVRVFFTIGNHFPRFNVRATYDGIDTVKVYFDKLQLGRPQRCPYGRLEFAKDEFVHINYNKGTPLKGETWSLRQRITISFRQFINELELRQAEWNAEYSNSMNVRMSPYDSIIVTFEHIVMEFI